MEYYLFTHFGPNTFTDKEWGHGDEPENIFDPTALDCEQWCRIAKAAGAKGIIVTAKHHDGFCLWPSKYSTHTVRESKWKNGKGDVLKELSQACKKYGLKFGVYLSPWDRNHPKYGTPAYNDVFVNMMKEIFASYGPIWEFWWDGANGEAPNARLTDSVGQGKKQVYDWKKFERTIRTLSPKTVVFSDIGPDIRWVGNEKGIAGRTNWNTLDTAGFSRGKGAPPTDTLNVGNINGSNWIPAECDVSIRPGWFYHKEEDEKVKTPEQLFQLYLRSVGRGANLLLNVPPDRRGLITANDSSALMGFKKLRDESFKNDLAIKAKASLISGDSIKLKGIINDGSYKTFAEIPDLKTQFLQLHFNKKTKVNCIVLQEDLQKGQAIEKFYIQIRNDEELKNFTETTMGHKRIITFPAMEAEDIFIHIAQQKQTSRITEVKAYLIDEKLIGK